MKTIPRWGRGFVKVVVIARHLGKKRRNRSFQNQARQSRWGVRIRQLGTDRLNLHQLVCWACSQGTRRVKSAVKLSGRE